MTAYEWGLVMFFIVWLAVPIIYINYYEPKIVNRDSDYFNVRKLERKILTFKRSVFLNGVLFLSAFVYDKAYYFWGEGIVEKKESLIRVILVLGVWLLIMFLCCRDHVALPLRRYLDTDEMINSIESERFYQIRKNMWHSKNWIRVSTKFYPKSVVIDIRPYCYEGHISLYVYTIWGKKYRSDGFYSIDKQFDPAFKQLIGLLPVSKESCSNRVIMRKHLGNDDVKKWIAEYMQTHSTLELIESDELLGAVVEKVRKEILYGRRRKPLEVHN